MSATKLSADLLFQFAKNRRSIYALNKTLSITPARIHEIVNEVTLHTPSSFNSQTGRVVILFGEEHTKLWNIVTETLKAIVPEDKWKPTADRMAGFQGAAGSVLFFVEETGVKTMQEQFAAFAPKFPGWAAESLAMQQYLTWTALEAEGLGANLQHYNPLIDAKVAETWKLPATWTLTAQLVFGGKVADAGDKTFIPVEERVKVFGA